MLNAEEALEWGNIILPSNNWDNLMPTLGLVDYVSAPESTGFERALSLAQTIVKNGRLSVTTIVYKLTSGFTAPLALRAAKQAISRSEDLPLETGNAIIVSPPGYFIHSKQAWTLNERHTRVS